MEEQALYWWNLAAKQQNTMSQKNLAKFYYKNKDLPSAKVWYKRAADNGDVEAMNWLGLVEMKEGNTDAGFQYFMQAANKGSAQAQCNVGIYYFNTKEFEAAKIWLEKAAKQGYKDAIEYLKRKEFQ